MAMKHNSQQLFSCNVALYKYATPICPTHLKLSARIGPQCWSEVGRAQIGHGIHCEVGHVTSCDLHTDLTHMNAHQGRERAAALVRWVLHCTLV